MENVWRYTDILSLIIVFFGRMRLSRHNLLLLFNYIHPPDPPTLSRFSLSD